MSGNDLPPLDECLSAMDERIEFLSSALSSLSEELTSRKPAAGGAANPLAVELTRVKAQLKETEAKLANSSSGDGASLAAMKDELSALRIENAELKATSSPTAGDGGRGSGTEVKAMKSKLVQANNEIDQLKKELSEKTEELEGMEDALSQAQQAAARGGAPGGPLQFEGLDVAETPKVITPTAMKRARGGAKQPQGRRRMSLASSFKAEGEDKLGRIERMVELLTNIPAARNVDALVGAVVNGTFTLMAPGITAVALWLAPHNKTYTAVDSSNVESSNELGSLFMKRIHEDPAAKVNVKRDDYMMYLGASAKEDDIPEAVMCLPIFSAHGHQQLMGILELRNARPAIMGDKGEFGTDDEELVQAITHQAGTSLDNVFYNNKMAQALQRYEYTQTDMATLKSQLVEAGKNLFEADCVMLARHNEVANTVVMDFSGGRSKTVPSGAGATWTVINSRVELGLPQLSSGNGASLRAEFDFADDEDPGMILHPVIGDGTVMGVIGVFGAGTEVDDELLQLVKLFSAQAATLMKNCELYTNAMSQNAKTKNKLELLDVSKAFASELDQHTLMMTIIEKTRTVLDADRCALFMVDELRNQMWASLHDGTIIRTGRSEGIVGWVATNNQPLNITDAYADARFNTDVDKETGYRTNSILAVPVHDAEKKLTGVIQMINKKGGPFGADDLDMLEMIASQAGVTLNNAAIFDEVKKDQENFNVLMDISKKLSSELNIQKLIQSIMDSAKGLLDCDRSTLFLADHQKNELYSYMADGVGTEIRLPLTAGIAGAVATTNQLINIPDAYEDPRFNQAFDRKTGYKTTSILCVPVMSSKGSLLGVCQMINKGGGGDKDNPVTPNLFFEKSDESLLGAFMSQAAVSIENAQLFEKAMSQKERLESTLASIQNLVMSFDSKGMLTGCNHDSWLEKYFSVTAESIGTKMSFKKWLSDYPEVVKEIKKTMETGVNYESLDSIKVLNEETGEEYFLNYSVNSLIRVAKKDASEGIGGAEDEGGCVLVFEDLSEKKKMTSTLGRYLSGALVDQVLGSGADVLGGVRQKVTILFSDIRSFTTISEGMDAVDLVAMLNDYFTYELDPIFDNGGILDKFIGDAIMACFGVPLVSEDDGKTDACMSCKCALEQLAALEIFNEMRKKERGPDTETFAIGIGLNTNKVVSGNIGSDKRMEYTVIGDGVNLASRLEGITKTYGVKVCMSEFTNQEVTSHFITREIDTVAVKGKVDGIKIFELIAAKDECDWASLSYRTDVPAEHAKYPTRVSGLPQAAALQPHLPAFDVALNNYRSQKFDEAIAGFSEIVAAVDDPVSKVLIGRCHEFKEDPPEANWDGIYRPKSK